MPSPIGPEISVIQKISVAIIHERNVEKLLENVLDILEKELGMLRGTFALLFGDTLKIEASRGLDEAEKQRGFYRMGEGITGHVAERGISHVIPDLRKDSRFLNRTGSRHYDTQVAFICVPLIHDEQIIGTLSIDRPVDGTTDLDRDVALLEIIANITGDAANECIELRNEQQAMIDENRKLRDMLSNNPSEIVGNCREMQIVYEQLRQVAPSDATVLIRGGSGTGKEMIARAIVNLSPRKDKPFITLNCAALPENLVESELFGHEKGAFTGAMVRRIGRAEAANGGTLFLDEIGDLTMQTQVKLLRFLQERTFSRVGSNEEIHADVRFLAATSRNLEELMAQGKFRREKDREALDDGHQHAHELLLAGQRPRTRELHGTSRAHREGRMHPQLQPAAFPADKPHIGQRELHRIDGSAPRRDAAELREGNPDGSHQAERREPLCRRQDARCFAPHDELPHEQAGNRFPQVITAIQTN